MIRCNNCGKTFRDIGRLKKVYRKPGSMVAKFSVPDEGKEGYEILRVCPECLTPRHLEVLPGKSRRKYRKGGHILSLDDLMKQDLIYFCDKIYHRGWFKNWKLLMVANLIGEKGLLFYVVKEEGKDGREKE